MTSKKQVTQEQVSKWCGQIAGAINNDVKTPIAILAPVRGGLVPGVYMSHLLGIPMFPMNYSLRDFKADLEIPTSFYHYMLNRTGKDVLLIDDIVDTGETFDGILSAFDRFDGVNLVTAALLHNTDQSIKVDYAGETFRRSQDDSWFEFFWEV